MKVASRKYRGYSRWNQITLVTRRLSSMHSAVNLLVALICCNNLAVLALSSHPFKRSELTSWGSLYTPRSNRGHFIHRPKSIFCLPSLVDADIGKDVNRITEFETNKPMSAFARLLTSGGQSSGNRIALHAANAKRKWSDPYMWTHIFFLINGLAAYQNEVFDLFLLTLITAPLSVWYHYSYEKPGKLAQLEGIAAKALFVYGVVQIFYAPSLSLIIAEIFMLIFTVVIFLGTNLKPHLYDTYHCLMHIIPPIWATIVALYHTPLLRFR